MHPLADTGRVIARRYRLEVPIGRGAMGVVWRARDLLLDRDVAVKEVQIAETLTDAERANAYQRTLREAKTAARLNHPAVVTVYDVAEDGGRPWIVMQLVRAQSLDQVLATSGPLSARRAAAMGRQLLSALSVAHAAGVMHRDVKPSNVLLGHDDRAVLTDFGIATFQGDPKLTQTGMVMGSPGFTAPERIRGEDASPASDLWSLGATLFAAVEGHGPFERRGGAITTMSAIINEDAPDATAAGALGPVIAALLRREPSDRPDAASAARMITDVLPLLPERTGGSRAGYEATALSASSRPGSPPQPGSAHPGSVRPRTPQPGEYSLNFAPADQTISREPVSPSAAGPGSPGGGSPGGGPPTPEQTAPTRPQPVLGDAARYGPSQGSWGQGGAAGSAPGSAPGSSSGYEPPPRPEGPPPPDFSSWYDSSPRSGPASPAAPPGYRPAPRPEAPPGYSPARRQRPGLGWKVAIVVLAIIGAGAGAATVVLLHQGHSGTPRGTSSTSSSTSSPSTPATGTTLAPANLITAINQPLTGPPPAGYRSYSQAPSGSENAGFSIDVPTSWTVQPSGAQTYLRDPGTNINMLVDLTPHTYPNNMVEEAQYIEAQSTPRFPGYQRVNLAALTIRGTSGAYWKFTWIKAGIEQTALDLLFVQNTASGPQSYALYATAPTSMWTQMQPVFDEELRTFAPLPK